MIDVTSAVGPSWVVDVMTSVVIDGGRDVDVYSVVTLDDHRQVGAVDSRRWMPGRRMMLGRLLTSLTLS